MNPWYFGLLCTWVLYFGNSTVFLLPSMSQGLQPTIPYCVSWNSRLPGRAKNPWIWPLSPSIFLFFDPCSLLTLNKLTSSKHFNICANFGYVTFWLLWICLLGLPHTVIPHLINKLFCWKSLILIVLLQQYESTDQRDSSDWYKYEMQSLRGRSSLFIKQSWEVNRATQNIDIYSDLK